MSTEDLLHVVHAAEAYRPEAVQAARDALAARQVAMNDPAVQRVIGEFEEAGVAAKQAADEPLSTGLKVICFIFCGIPGIAIAVHAMSQGRTRRANEAWRWVVYGWLTPVVLFVLFKLL